MENIRAYLSKIAYPGRGVLLGVSEDGAYGVAAYFIMGRSVNSRNRVFSLTEDGIRTEAFDEKLLTDPSLIIYHPVRRHDDALIVTNGDQTDTIADFLARGLSFEEALETRVYEPDMPNFTPRVSGLLRARARRAERTFSILKKDSSSDACVRETSFFTDCAPGEANIIHTYEDDGNPLPSFTGGPRAVAIPGDLDVLTDAVWDGLNEDNRISLFVRFVSLSDSSERTRIVNKHVR